MSARNRILPVFVPHLGCPHACVFCNQREITGHSAELAMAELQRFCVTAERPAELAFYGGSFTSISPAEQIAYLRVAKKAIDAGKADGIRLSTRPDAIDEETLRRLKEFGVSTIELGAQSMQDGVLEKSGRGHTADDVRVSSQLIRDYGFQLVLQMMTGLPGDDDDGAIDTAQKLIELKPDAVRIYPTVIVRGTELERMWRDGRYREHTVEDAVCICSRLLPLFLGAEIPVLRIGLNPTEELSSGAALAGAYHPALGELVKSRILRNQAEEMIGRAQLAGEDVCIEITDNRLSQMTGQNRCNVVWLRERFELRSLKIIPCRQAGVFRVFKSA